MAIGHEDTKAWAHFVANAADAKKPIDTCQSCKRTISIWHCKETGCPWCRACGVQNSKKFWKGST